MNHPIATARKRYTLQCESGGKPIVVYLNPEIWSPKAFLEGQFNLRLFKNGSDTPSDTDAITVINVHADVMEFKRIHAPVWDPQDRVLRWYATVGARVQVVRWVRPDVTIRSTIWSAVGPGKTRVITLEDLQTEYDEWCEWARASEPINVTAVNGQKPDRRRAALDSAPVGAGTATSPRWRGHAGVGVYVPDQLRVGQRENRDWVLLSGPTRNAFVWTPGVVDAPALDCRVMTEQFSVQDINAPDGRLGDRYHAWQKPDDLRSVLFVTARSRAGCGSGSVRRNREFLIGSGAAWA